MAAKSTEGNSSPSTDPVFQLERARFELLNEIEAARLELQHSYAAKKMELLKANKAEAEWLLGALAELRKERVTFQKKAIAEISAALAESKVNETLSSEWLTNINKLYHEDIALAQKMISVDIEEVDSNLFQQLKKGTEERIRQAIESRLSEQSTNTGSLTGSPSPPHDGGKGG